MRGLAVLGLLLLPWARAQACPDCASTALVRDSVFDGSFWPNLFMLALPLAVLAAISARLYHLGGGRRVGRD